MWPRGSLWTCQKAPESFCSSGMCFISSSCWAVACMCVCVCAHKQEGTDVAVLHFVLSPSNMWDAVKSANLQAELMEILHLSLVHHCCIFCCVAGCSSSVRSLALPSSRLTSSRGWGEQGSHRWRLSMPWTPWTTWTGTMHTSWAVKLPAGLPLPAPSLRLPPWRRPPRRPAFLRPTGPSRQTTPLAPPPRLDRSPWPRLSLWQPWARTALRRSPTGSCHHLVFLSVWSAALYPPSGLIPAKRTSTWRTRWKNWWGEKRQDCWAKVHL